jgi:hypothetical protein
LTKYTDFLGEKAGELFDRINMIKRKGKAAEDWPQRAQRDQKLEDDPGYKGISFGGLAFFVAVPFWGD